MLKKTKTVLSIALTLCLPSLSDAQENATARIRVSNDNVTNIYLNSTCVDKNSKDVIHASNAGAGFSTWGTPKREGMPGNPKELYNGYSEYRIPAGSPITIEFSKEGNESRARLICIATMLSFVPEANADYEVWGLINVNAKRCTAVVRQIKYSAQAQRILSRPIPNLKPAVSCEQQNAIQQ